MKGGIIIVAGQNIGNRVVVKVGTANFDGGKDRGDVRSV